MNQLNPYSKIRFTETGTGPLLVLIPGLGLNTLIFDDLVSLLAPQYQCLCLEFSGNVPSKAIKSCSIESTAHEVQEFLHHHNRVPHAVIGHSLGGFVAMHLSLLAPTLVPDLVLLASAAQGDPSLLPFFLPRTMTSASAVLESNMAQCVTESFRKTPAFRRAMKQQRRHSGSGKCFVPLLRASTHFDLVDKLPNIESRTLVICGKEDPLAPTAQAQILANGIPNAQTICFHNVAHLPQIEAPERTAEAIVHFLHQESSQTTVSD